MKTTEGNVKEKMTNSYEMKRGEVAIVLDIDGGGNLVDRLSNIGIRIGKQIRKVCNQPLSGPVQLKVDNTEIAIGMGMAKKILVKVVSSQTC